MKKHLIVLSLILIIIGMVGCDLNPLNQHKQYFYSLAGEGNADSSKTIKYRSDGHTIIMSRGKGGQVLTEAQANALNSPAKTEFSLTLDGTALTPINTMSVDKLADGYHVVQYFSLGVMNKGPHTLVGVTQLKEEGGTRTNKVYLTVK